MGAVGRIGGSYSSLAKKLDFMPRILVRALFGNGCGDPCSFTVFHDLGVIGLPHPDPP